jgi:diguanylate cyclase (GGDEF)-like protein
MGADLERKSRTARQAALASTLLWVMLGLLATLAHDLGLTHLSLRDIVPLILLAGGASLLIQAFLHPRLMRQLPLPLPTITLIAIGIQAVLMLQLIRLDHYGYLAAFSCLLGLVTMLCYLGINFGGRISLLAGVVVTLLVHSLYSSGGHGSSLLQPEQEFLFVASALAITTVMAIANSFQRRRRKNLAQIYKVQAEQNRIIRRQQQTLDLRARELAHANEALRQLSLVDGLTGVANRRCFNDTLRREWLRHARVAALGQRGADPLHHTGLALLLIDIDAFKAYNDHYGHSAGDHCLRQVADAIRSATLRLTDLTARYGGEEFAVLLPDTDVEGAEKVARRIMGNLQALNIAHDDSPVAPRVTVSLGIAHVGNETRMEAEALLQLADQALYQAKNQGRNRIMVHALA